MTGSRTNSEIDLAPYQRRNRHFEELVSRPDLVWMGQNTNHLSTHPDVRKALVAAVENEAFHAYAPPAGLGELRRLILDDVGIENADVLITDGAILGLYHACRHFIQPGDRMLTTDPTWLWPTAFAGLSGAEVVALPIYDKAQDYKLTPDQLAEAARNGGVRLIYLVDPLNPLGISYSRAEIEAFTDIARQYGAWLVHDCTYRHFAHDHTLAHEFYPEGTLTTYSFSKWLGFAGLRLGGLIACPDVLEILSNGQPNSLGSNMISQLGAIAGLKAKAEWFPEVLRVSRLNQERIGEVVERIGGLSLPVWPSHGNFVAIDCSASGVSPEKLCDLFLNRDIMIRHAGYHSERFKDCFIKVSTTVPTEQAQRFCDALPEVMEEARQSNVAARKMF